ncbi:MAG: hypothetical protein Pg6A_15800 [Termitinemataceae bacterium]|nr:MAG: hypothetical protein Pg6A_15800 [Termitinemataceae bacterium]
MPSIRTLAAYDFQKSVLADCQPVVAITPDGERITQTATGDKLRAVVRMAQTKLTDEGVAVITPAPSLRFASADLTRLPRTGEKWAFVICEHPQDIEPSMVCLMDTEAALNGGNTIGWIDIPLILPEAA